MPETRAPALAYRVMRRQVSKVPCELCHNERLNLYKTRHGVNI